MPCSCSPTQEASGQGHCSYDICHPVTPNLFPHLLFPEVQLGDQLPGDLGGSAVQWFKLGLCSWADPWVRKIPWRRVRQPIPVFLPEESHGQRSLAGYSSWGRKQLDMTERLTVSPPAAMQTWFEFWLYHSPTKWPGASHFSEPQFPHLENRSKSTRFQG